MGNIFSCYKYKIEPENIYKIDKLIKNKSFRNRRIMDSHKNPRYSTSEIIITEFCVQIPLTKTIIKIKSASNLESICLLPMSRHGSMRLSKSLDFLNLM